MLQSASYPAVTIVGGNIGHFDDEIDLAGSEGLGGMKVDNITRQKIVSSLPAHTGCLCQLKARRLPLARETNEKVAGLHLSVLGAAHTAFLRNTQILEVSRLRGPSRGDTTSIQLQSSVEIVTRSTTVTRAQLM